MLGQQRVQLTDPRDALGQLAAGQPPARLVLDFQIVMGLGLARLFHAGFRLRDWWC